MTDPKYQISCFPSGDKGTQWVVRSDSFEEIQKMKTEMESMYPTQMALKTETVPTLEDTIPDAAPSKACWKCGEPATFRKGVSKTGKPWRAFFCSTDDKSHVEWL